jgi:hypothetical protein
MRLITLQNKLQPTVTIQVADDYIEDHYGTYDVHMLELNENHNYINTQRISLVVINLEELISDYKFPTLLDGSYPSFIDKLKSTRNDLVVKMQYYVPSSGILYQYREMF